MNTPRPPAVRLEGTLLDRGEFLALFLKNPPLKGPPQLAEVGNVIIKQMFLNIDVSKA
jgi:hypothetical protein